MTREYNSASSKRSSNGSVQRPPRASTLPGAASSWSSIVCSPGSLSSSGRPSPLKGALQWRFVSNALARPRTSTFA